MSHLQRVHSGRQRGAVIVVSMIFVVLFAVLAMSLAAISGSNAQIAVNQIYGDRARACAESGLQVIRYWFSQLALSGTIPAEQRLERLSGAFQTLLTNQAVTNLAPSYSSRQVVIPAVSLDTAANERFGATISQIDSDTLQVDVTGTHDEVSRSIRANYTFTTRANTVFDFGVASKGPLSVHGNIEIDGVNVAVESNAYIESLDDFVALTMIGNSSIAGNVKIVNPLATPDIGTRASVGGESGENAFHHIQTGVPPTEFPEPNPAHFASYATNIIDTHTALPSDAVFENVRIRAGTNPSFAARNTFKGVVFIETPNVVTFTGGVTITGIIVGNGNLTDDSGANSIHFGGNVTSYSASTLPSLPQFAGLHAETGTFIMAPGFSVDFGGTFSTVSGAIAANGVSFSGNAGGTIQGSIVNYANRTMNVGGNSDLHFNRSGLTSIPAGFVPQVIMVYDANAYSEPAL